MGKGTREKVQELLDKGLSIREIAIILGLSTQAIYRYRNLEEGETR